MKGRTVISGEEPIFVIISPKHQKSILAFFSAAIGYFKICQMRTPSKAPHFQRRKLAHSMQKNMLYKNMLVAYGGRFTLCTYLQNTVKSTVK